jgi:TRAP-type C4-dicarboxylate transport system permease small subunit
MLRPKTIWQILGIALGLLGLILVGWSGWLYHFAAVADTTDETSTFWIAAGSFILVLACGTLMLALHYLRRGRRRAPEHTGS